MNFDVLRQKILEKAIRGELVPQLESEPEVPQIGKALEEVPFALPRKWKWIQLENLFLFIDYRGKTPTKSECGIRLITASNVKKGYIDHQRVEYISLSEYESRQSRGISKKGDILFTTEAPLGNAALADLDTYSAGQRVITLRSSNNLMLHEFAVYEILSSFFQKILKDNATGTTAKGIKAARLKKLWIPVPPLEEQARIGAKIRLLFGQMDYAEKTYRELSGPLSERFRQLCLEKAIQGKLVPQLESEPEVAQIGETPENVPFTIPEKWKWVRLGVFVRVISGTSYRPQDTTSAGDGIRILRGGNVGQQYQLLTADNDVFVSKDLYSEDKQIRKGDIVIVASTGSKEAIGRPAFAEADINSQIGAFLRIIRCTNQDLVPFIQIIFMSDLYRGRIRSLVKGTNINNIKKSYIEDLFIPCPPVEEQHRIAEKINKLLGAVVRLENTISAT